VRIYLACTVRGDRGAVAALRTLVARLEQAGHTILTTHLLDDDVDTAESALTEADVYTRDLKWLESCDLLIADASGSSYGVGFEVGYVLGRSDRTNQRVVLLYDVARRDKISRLIAGNSNSRCTVLTYKDPVDLVDQVLRVLSV
jgi:2'-deoxynucleoside 5'-phosphate N-hydrolase